MNRKNKRLSKEEELELFEMFEENKGRDNLLSTISINVKSKNHNQKELAKSIKSKDITICSGPAGTGKTYIACAEAIKLLKGSNKYNQIILIKSVTTLKDESLGYLKGTLDDKLEPAMMSYYHNFHKLIGIFKTSELKKNKYIEEYPVAYMRGINFDNCVLIVDEAQNLTKQNMRTIMTRVGFNSKLVILGDTKQKDLKNHGQSSLEFIVEKFRDVDDKIGVVELTVDDIVRNPLIKKIEDVFDE